jgi:hypothetical protein
MQLRDIAHSRTGDKGNISNVSVIAFDPKDWDILRIQVTAERVRAHFATMITGPVERYELPQISALNFVLHDALAGGVTRSLALDPHGKCLSSLILTLDIEKSAC